MQTLTLVYPLRDTEICLGYKKRGFGANLWNGFGGKIEGTETPLEGAVRELTEEAGLITTTADLEPVGELTFIFPDNTTLLVYTYFVTRWEGELQETEEMRPTWFLHEEIPYELMWADDIHWLPHALVGEYCVGTVWFDETNAILDMQWQFTPREHERAPL